MQKKQKKTDTDLSASYSVGLRFNRQHTCINVFNLNLVLLI